MPTLQDIAMNLGCPPPPGTPIVITGVATLTEATATELSYVATDLFVRELAGSRAAALIVQKKVKLPASEARPILWVDDAELAIAKTLAMFAPPIPRPPVGVDPMSRVDASAVLDQGVAVGPFTFIGARARIGAGSVVHPGVYIGDDVVLGECCELYPNVTIRERVTLGNRVIIHAGSVIGSDGFGYRWDGRQHAKIPQIGVVIIEDDVELGSCVCIDRAKFSATRIGRGAKIDNLVQVGHNVQVGPNCIITGQVGLAGSVKLGAGVVMGGQSAVREHVSIGDGAMIAGTSGVADDVPAGQIYSGIPALPHRQSLREQKALRRLPTLAAQIQTLMEELESLKKKASGQST